MNLDLPELNGWLETFLNFERAPNTKLLKLETMKILCEYFDNPQNCCPCFHVAGSKGKGTIAAYIAGILRDKGYKTGVYASPHLRHFVERVGTGNGPFSAKIYNAAYKELRSGVEEIIKKKLLSKNVVTWYELVTIFAMLCFKKAKVDFAIYEVGMGGRLDATNIINPCCIAMGPIELEHTKILGDTLEKIAIEKAGVFKKNTSVVSAPQKSEVRKVFIEKAKKAKIKELELVPASTKDYQKIDAEIAMRAVNKILPEINKKEMADAISKVHLPGRYEFFWRVPEFKNIPFVLVDVAHTRNSIKQVLAKMKAENISGNLIFGCAIDKDVNGMAKEVISAGIFDAIFLTKPGDFKKSDLLKMEKAFENNKAKIICSGENYEEVIIWALKACDREKKPLIVLGSFYLADEVLKAAKL